MIINGLYKTATVSLSSDYNDRQNLRQCFFSGNNAADTFQPSQDFVQGKLAQRLSETADNYLRKNQDKEAQKYYKKAIEAKADFTPSYYGLAKVYKNSDKLPQAHETYEKLLTYHPEELEAQTLMGLCYKKLGKFDKARQTFEQACKKDSKYDYAARFLKEINNLILAKTDPELAQKLKDKQSDETLHRALTIVVNNMSPSIINKLHDIDYSFDKTDSLSGHPNIAQYENNKRKIVVTEEYRWAAPEVVATYLVHENVHGSDKDGLTSVHEEQDAYEASIKFWVQHNNGIKDPELDYAAELYNQSPQKLRAKVADIYRSRDKSIPDYSPNHMPKNLTSHSKISALHILGTKLSALLGFTS